MGWQVVERWEANGEIAVWCLWLKQVVDEPFSTAWRVEWGELGGYRRGVSFTGNDREQLAREELQRRKEQFTYGVWRQVA